MDQTLFHARDGLALRLNKIDGAARAEEDAPEHEDPITEQGYDELNFERN